jgi:DNA-binding MurR/RpiR family transcriptional regulator
MEQSFQTIQGEAGPFPKDFAALKARIAARAPDMPRRLTQVANYALRFPDEMAFGTVASIAMNAEVQPSTLVRFSQSLGFKGFSDLQEVFRSRLRGGVPGYGERLKSLQEHHEPSSGPTAIFQGFHQAAQASLEELHAKLDQAQLQAMVQTLAASESIFLVAMQRTYPITAYMAYAWSKLGVRNQLVDGKSGLGLDAMGFATPRDSVLAISFSPYASETATLATSAGLRGVPVVSITDSVFSPLASISKVWIEVQESNYEGFRSLSATLALAMTLTVAVAEQREARKKP